MKFNTEKIIVDIDGNKIRVWDVVTIKYLNGGGCGGCQITKITDKGFRFVQGSGREKTVPYDLLSEIHVQRYANRIFRRLCFSYW